MKSNSYYWSIILFCTAVLSSTISAKAESNTISLVTGKDANWVAYYFGTLGHESYNPANKGTTAGTLLSVMYGSDTSAYTKYQGYSADPVDGKIRVYESGSELNGAWQFPSGNQGDAAPWMGIWNGLSVDGGATTSNAWNLGGYYAYQTSFDIADGTEKAALQGSFAKDNDVVGIYLKNTTSSNGTWLAIPDGMSEGNYKPYDIGKVDFLTSLGTGNYELTFFVTNAITDNPWVLLGPTGFRSEMFVESSKVESLVATPEPATLAILGLGLIGTGITARRRLSK